MKGRVISAGTRAVARRRQPFGPDARKCLVVLALPACHEPATSVDRCWEGSGEVVSSSCPPPRYERLIAGTVRDPSGREVPHTRLHIISQSLRPEGCVWHGPVKAVFTSPGGAFAERLGSVGPVGCVTVRAQPPPGLALAETVVDTRPVTNYDTRDPMLATDTLIVPIVLTSVSSATASTPGFSPDSRRRRQLGDRPLSGGAENLGSVVRREDLTQAHRLAFSVCSRSGELQSSESKSSGLTLPKTRKPRKTRRTPRRFV